MLRIKKIWVKSAIISSIVMLLAFTVCGIFLYFYDIYEETEIIWYYVIISSVSVIIGTLTITFFMLEITKPISKLINATSHMAEGKYSGEKVDCKYADEIGELTLHFNNMRKTIDKHVAQLEDTAQRQQLFISGLTHEIKTPLASMMIHTDTLLTADLTLEESQNSLEHLYEQCRWMERLSQKLLILLTTEVNIEIRPVRVEELFEDVSKNMMERLQSQNTPLVIECEIDVLDMDYDLMKSLIINLVDNASKASKSGQEIKLRAYKNKSINTCNESLEVFTNIIEVSDNGHGIPEEEIDRVTDTFYMVDRSRSKKFGGSGLGLAIVKRIADAHNIKLKIESELSKGTTVKVVF